jgi:hypothetical protein
MIGVAMRKFVLSIAILISFALLVAVKALAQGQPPDDNATYVLTKAIKDPQNLNNIDVAFGKSFPSCTNDANGTGNSPAAEDPNNWVIRIEALGNSQRQQPGTRTTITPVSATVPNVCQDKLVTLTLNQTVEDTNDGLFDATTHK